MLVFRGSTILFLPMESTCSFLKRHIWVSTQKYGENHPNHPILFIGFGTHLFSPSILGGKIMPLFLGPTKTPVKFSIPLRSSCLRASDAARFPGGFRGSPKRFPWMMINHNSLTMEMVEKKSSFFFFLGVCKNYLWFSLCEHVLTNKPLSA